MPGEPPTQKAFFAEAIRRALCEEMDRDPSLILLGQDIGAYGGPYREFVGLQARFGRERVRDTPVAEAAMVGVAAGAAAAGSRALVSITYMDFLTLALDPLVNYAAKARFKTGGQLAMPLVVKTTAGARGQGVAHSQCLESWLMGVPGLTVVAPSTAADAYGLLKSALRADAPVVFVDHKRLFPTAGQIPTGETLTPIGEAAVRREGSHVTLVSHSFMTRVCLQAAEILAGEGLSCEVIDLRSLAPLDVGAVVRSAGRTGALVTVEEGQATCGVGAEVAFQVREQIADLRVARAAALPAPVSSNPVLEAAVVPDAARVCAAVRQLLGS